MPTGPRTPGKVSVRGRHWKRSIAIASDRYAVVSEAILASLSTTPIRFSELVAQVRGKIPDFQGSVSWYTISIARQLELEGLLVRRAKPVLYSKPTKGRVKSALSRGENSRGNKVRARSRRAAQQPHAARREG